MREWNKQKLIGIFRNKNDKIREWVTMEQFLNQLSILNVTRGINNYDRFT